MKRSQTLATGLALILVTNAVVLAGVAYNRSGEPESLLKLSQRELPMPGEWGFEGENSGVSLAIAWRVHPGPGSEAYDFGHSYGGEAAWLDRAKLESLGFDLTEPALRETRQLPRDALLVLEVDGPAHRAALRRAEERANRKPEEWMLRQLKHERETSSRLFVVDAGVDLAALRAKYPNRSQYAIVKGKVRIYRATRGKAAAGFVAGVNITGVHVPVEMHGALRRGGNYEATVAFGRRLEPWLRSASGMTR
jgi:hypothetical protein